MQNLKPYFTNGCFVEANIYLCCLFYFGFVMKVIVMEVVYLFYKFTTVKY